MIIVLAFALSGCSSKQESKLDDQSIPKAIASLTYTDNDITTIIEPTGNPILRTDQEKYIISKGKESVPYLIKAIATQSNLLVIGGAAFCLGKIGDRTGVSTATITRQKLIALDLRSREAIFAEKRLKEYLILEAKSTERDEPE